MDENYEEEEYTDDFMEGYISGLNMATDVVKEHEYLSFDLQPEITDLFIRYFREIKGHNYNEKQLLFAVVEDDVKDFIDYVGKILQQEYFEKGV